MTRNLRPALLKQNSWEGREHCFEWGIYSFNWTAVTLYYPLSSVRTWRRFQDKQHERREEYPGVQRSLNATCDADGNKDTEGGGGGGGGADIAPTGRRVPAAFNVARRDEQPPDSSSIQGCA